MVAVAAATSVAATMLAPLRLARCGTLLSNPRARCPSGLRTHRFLAVPEPEKRARRIVSVASRLGRARHPRLGGLAVGNFRGDDAPLSPQRAVRSRDAQRDLRPTAAMETPSQSLRSLGPAPGSGLRQSSTSVGSGATAGSSGGAALRVRPVICPVRRSVSYQSSSAAPERRRVLVEAKAADRREWRRLVRSASPTRVVVHRRADTLASMMSDNVKAALRLQGPEITWLNAPHLRSC